MVPGNSPTAVKDLLSILMEGMDLQELLQRPRSRLAEILEKEGVPAAPSALYLSAGEDTMPFTFLSPAFLEHQGVEGFEWPELFVYVDKGRPPDGEMGKLWFEDDRGTMVVSDYTDTLDIEGSHAVLMNLTAVAREPESFLTTRLLRIRAENQAVLPMLAEAGWSPDVIISVCDGCAFGGQEDGRCENDLASESSIVHYLRRPPKWWVTDHWTPRDWLPRLPEGVDWRFRRVTPLSSEWGHPWRPLHGANLFEVTA
jgi:hypothetical protein